jgi:gluconokinase
MRTRFIILMGVSGSGKTTVGKALAHKLGWGFYDADDFHSELNIEKMKAGIPLTDDDRKSWLVDLNRLISTSLKKKQPGVLACSALKESYRQIILANNPGTQIVFLKGNYDLIHSRIDNRPEHFMKQAMLQSQFDALEEPKNTLTVDVSTSVEEIVKTIVNELIDAI